MKDTDRARAAVGTVVAGLLMGVALISWPASSQRATGPAQLKNNQAQIERGAYLTTIGGCADCHTPGYFYAAPDGTRHLSGSEVGWKGPWGTTYPLNLTPDTETGLGAWTDDDIVRAIRTGQRPDGSTLRPPMPWQNYARLTDDDARAIVAYLRSITPVRHVEPAALPPGQEPLGAVFEVPAPPPWDAPRKPTATAPSQPTTPTP